MREFKHELLSQMFEHETIKIGGVPYLTRYYLSGKNRRQLGEGPSVFLHCFHTSDQGRELHNHPYTGTSYILKGAYTEERVADRTEPVYTQRYEPGSVNYLQLDTFHRTELDRDSDGNFIECWTLFIAGERVQSWGFLDRTTREFFPYMDSQDERLGRGPHSREEIDTATAERCAGERI